MSSLIRTARIQTRPDQQRVKARPSAEERALDLLGQGLPVGHPRELVTAQGQPAGYPLGAATSLAYTDIYH